MGAVNSRPPKRNPLSDCTNTIASHSSSVASTSTASSRFKLNNSDKPDFNKLPSSRTIDDNITTSSTTQKQHDRNRTFVSQPKESTPPPPPPLQSSVAPEALEPLTVCTRRQSAEEKGKEKVVDTPLIISSAREKEDISSDHTTVSTSKNHGATNVTSVPELLDSTPPGLPQSSVFRDVDDSDVFEAHPVYTRRWSAEKRDKEKSVDAPLTRSAKKRRSISSGNAIASTSNNRGDTNVTSVPEQLDSTPPRLLQSSVCPDVDDSDVFETTPVYTRRRSSKKRDKGNSVDAPLTRSRKKRQSIIGKVDVAPPNLNISAQNDGADHVDSSKLNKASWEKKKCKKKDGLRDDDLNAYIEQQ